MSGSVDENSEPPATPAPLDASFVWEWNDQERGKTPLEATPAERLAWLEEGIELAYRAGALPNREAGDASETDSGETDSGDSGGEREHEA